MCAMLLSREPSSFTPSRVPPPPFQPTFLPIDISLRDIGDVGRDIDAFVDRVSRWVLSLSG